MKPKILVSSCAMGNAVRHNGGSKKHQWVAEDLNKDFDIVTVCPEMSMGLGTPREAMRLEKKEKGGSVELHTSKTKKNLTDLAHRSNNEILANLGHNIHGALVMGGSPTCGLERVKIWEANGIPHKSGTGLFAAALQEQYKHIPIMEVGRMSDEGQRELFLTQVAVMYDFSEEVHDVSSMQLFHQKYKYLMMSHSQELMRHLGAIAAQAKNDATFTQSETEYKDVLFQLINTKPTVGKLRNALTHVYGYIKNDMAPEQKKYLINLLGSPSSNITDYSKAIINIINFENTRQQNHYLSNQVILNQSGRL